MAGTLHQILELQLNGFRDERAARVIQAWSRPLSAHGTNTLVFDTGGGIAIGYSRDEEDDDAPWYVIEDLDTDAECVPLGAPTLEECVQYVICRGNIPDVTDEAAHASLVSETIRLRQLDRNTQNP